MRASFFIDHATGIVIGETTVIKDQCQNISGSYARWNSSEKEFGKNQKGTQQLKNNVTLYANATVLGGNVSIGQNSIIGANVSVTESINENSIVINESGNKLLIRNK